MLRSWGHDDILSGWYWLGVYAWLLNGFAVVTELPYLSLAVAED